MTTVIARPAYVLNLARRNMVGGADGHADELVVALGTHVEVPAGTAIMRLDEPVGQALVVISGALVRERLTPAGARQVLSTHVPGDVLGIQGTLAGRHTADLRAATHCRLAPLAPGWADGTDGPRFKDFLCTMEAAEQAMMEDRLVAVGRLSARDRMVHLLLALESRQRLWHHGAEGAVWFPFTQTVLGDMVGLTNVYVSKMLAALRADGTIATDLQTIMLNEPDGIAGHVDFIDRYAAMGLLEHRIVPLLTRARQFADAPVGVAPPVGIAPPIA